MIFLKFDETKIDEVKNFPLFRAKRENQNCCLPEDKRAGEKKILN